MKMRHYTEHNRRRRATISRQPKPHAAPNVPSSVLESREEFLPNLCSVYGVFALVLVAELLSLALVLADGGLRDFAWYKLGVTSLLIEWIVLCSAACLCSLRLWFNRRTPLTAGCVSYLVVLAITALFSVLGQFVERQVYQIDGLQLLSHLLIAAVFGGVALRYLFLQQQLQNQQQAELRARVQALQSRIRPHFLFNSMNSIASLIESEPVLAERMVEDLSGLFRASLSEPGLIPLERELDLCRRFVRIEQLRLGDRLRFRWQLPEQLPAGAQIPSLLLQPLVENAVYHGVQPLPEGGEVEVALTLEGGDCIIRVTNPSSAVSEARSGHGLALNNIRHRLAAYYGPRGALLLTPGEKVFTAVVRFPLTSD